MRAGEKLTLIWELTTTFVTFWNSCVALKRTVFCKRCYCCLMPVIFAWNSAKYLSDLCRDLSGKTCFNFGCWFPDLSVSQTSIFFRILYYFCCYFHCGKIWWLSEVWSFFCFTGVSFASNIYTYSWIVYFFHIILQETEECKMWPKFICTFFRFATKFQQILS